MIQRKRRLEWKMGAE